VHFGDTFATAMPTLRGQIAAASLGEARRLAHTLKGVAGTLETRAVADAAGQIEDALAGGDLTRIEGQLDRLQQAMLPALAVSAKLKCASTPAAVADVAAAADYTASAPMIAEMRELLRRRSLRARKTFDVLDQALGATPEAVGLHPVKAALERLAYGEALLMLDKIAGVDDIAVGPMRVEGVVS